MSNVANRQSAGYPSELATLVRSLEYKPGWDFLLEDIDRGQGSRGLTLIVTIHARNAYAENLGSGRPVTINVAHYFPVPPAAYDDRSWRRWLFEQILLVERHEAMEFFISDGARTYAPSHGPGNDPYLLREVGTDLDRRTSFRGEVNA